MALAKLCVEARQHLREKSSYDQLDLSAFIVDHQARYGSREEAQAVSSQLNQMGTEAL